MIYELRVYHAMPGKMPALLERFRSVTRHKFEQHGITVIGYWTQVVGENDELMYICQYQDWAARERAWAAFLSDPEWIAARAESERDGPLVRLISTRMLRSTDFSPLP